MEALRQIPLIGSSVTLMRGARYLLVLYAVLAFSLCLGAIAVVVRQPPAALPPASDSLLPLTPDDSPVPGDDTRAFTERPLFWASRRPPPEIGDSVDAPEAAPEEYREFRLVGLVASGRRAGVIVIANGQRERLWVGDSLGQWTLDSVAGVTATFIDERGDSRVVSLDAAGQ